MIHFLLALNIRGQVRLCRFYCSFESEHDNEVSTKQGARGRIPKPVFRKEGTIDKSTAFNPLLVRLASSGRGEITKSNSTSDFERKRGVERAKSWNLSHSSSGSALIDWTEDVSETLSHSVPNSEVVTKEEDRKTLAQDNVDLIGLSELDQEQGNFSRPSRSFINRVDNNQTKKDYKERERTTKESLKNRFISYRLFTNVEDGSSLSPAKKAFIDRIYAQVVSQDYQNSPNFMNFQKYKIVFRRYANLYFIVGVDMDDDEFAMLEWIHLWLEVLDEYFGDATELDLMYNFYKCYLILDEMICGGNIVETSKDIILTRLAQLEKLEK
ncbi:hypothetical protein GpartN1_g1613.t1 [Galdieria partita]|uniref:AP complex mu/sigma subunit domain-containing protein n=1 Tax=Galdieria partita TaxID=83374 RepID=A0A9C7PUF6_9RHOD|nr:hypothetical protein GpartN1_g1613.t1 [Galdieria partita]